MSITTLIAQTGGAIIFGPSADNAHITIGISRSSMRAFTSIQLTPAEAENLIQAIRAELGELALAAGATPPAMHIVADADIMGENES